jgi:hypothetical protein
VSDKTTERADYVVMNNTGAKAKRLVDFKMTQDMANRVSSLLGLAFLNSMNNADSSAWVNSEKGDPFPVRYKPHD